MSWLSRLPAAAIVLAVMNMTVAPCAMAFDEGRHCPNCPPEREHRMTGHHGHGEPEQALATDCASLQAQCGDLDKTNVDLRSGQPDSDHSQPVAVAQFPVAELSVPRVVAPVAVGPPSSLCRGSPRLYKLHCVYRD